MEYPFLPPFVPAVSRKSSCLPLVPVLCSGGHAAASSRPYFVSALKSGKHWGSVALCLLTACNVSLLRTGGAGVLAGGPRLGSRGKGWIG